MPKVNPAILIWARETAGLTRGEAARKLGIGNSERLRAFEEGANEPTGKQLQAMSEKYRRPLLAFYLHEPPKERDRGHDFRTFAEPPPFESEVLLNTLVRNVQSRQQLIKSALQEQDEAPVLDFVGTATIDLGVSQVSNSIESVLRISLDEFRAQETPTKAFSYLRNAAEKKGVFVLLMGNLGTHHTNIDPKVFRGMAIADDAVPFIVINENDSRAAWSFTLLHELAHIWLGQTGISGYTGANEVERFCDAVAARFLLRPNELTPAFEVGFGLDVLRQKIGDFAAERNISRKMVAYNLLGAGLIDASKYLALSNLFDAERLAQKSLKKEDSEGGPNYYVVRRHRVGMGLVEAVRRMVGAGVMSTPKAGEVLGVKPTAVGRLVGETRAA